MTVRRRRTDHSKPFQQRLIDEALKSRQAAEQLPPGTERELLMKRARQAEQAAQISDWLTAPNQPPPAAISKLLISKHD